MWRVPPSLCVETSHVGNKTSCCECHPVLTLNNISFFFPPLFCHHLIINLIFFALMVKNNILQLMSENLRIEMFSCGDINIFKYSEKEISQYALMAPHWCSWNKNQCWPSSLWVSVSSSSWLSVTYINHNCMFGTNLLGCIKTNGKRNCSFEACVTCWMKTGQVSNASWRASWL